MYSVKVQLGEGGVTKAPPGYRGWYINLDGSADRRARMDAQIAALGLASRYERFAAVAADAIQPRATGLSAREQACFQSHCSVLERAKALGVMAHVLEDDVVLSRHAEPAILALRDSGALNGFDITFTETFVPPQVMLLRQLKEGFDAFLKEGLSRIVVHDVSTNYAAGFTSYIVQPSACDRVLAILREGLAGGSLPIDLWVRQAAAAGRLRIGCVFPFITSIVLGEQTTMADRGGANAQLSRAVFDLLRYSFFVGRDFDGHAANALQRLSAITRELDADRHSRLIADVLQFVVASDQFSEF